MPAPDGRSAPTTVDLPGLAGGHDSATSAICSPARSMGSSEASTSCRHSRRRAIAASRRSRTTRSNHASAPGTTSASISERHDVLLDLMINHISRESPEFQDFLERGRRSPSADLFMTLDKVWEGGDPASGDVARIFLRKPEDPFSVVTIAVHRRDRADLDHVRDEGLGRADRSRCDLGIDPGPDHRAGSDRSPSEGSGSFDWMPSDT